MRVRHNNGRYARKIRVKAGDTEIGGFYLTRDSIISSGSTKRKATRRVRQTAPDHKRTLAYTALFLFFVFYFFAPFNSWLKSESTFTLLASELPTTTPTPVLIDETISEGTGSDSPGSTSEPEVVGEIEQMIIDVFGEHSDKAFKLLTCENPRHDPNAINTSGNYPEGSKDVGVFQINEYWQEVNYRFLLDPEINIRIAWKIYENNGFTFERWTCGRRLGI